MAMTGHANTAVTGLVCQPTGVAVCHILVQKHIQKLQQPIGALDHEHQRAKVMDG